MKRDEIILEQYKLYINTLENASKRRQSANNYFLAINSAILTVSITLFSKGLIESSDLFIGLGISLIGLIGLLVAILWFQTIISFREESNAKYNVIHNIENPSRVNDELKKLESSSEEYKLFDSFRKSLSKTPLTNLIQQEWYYLRKQREIKSYSEKTTIEKRVPQVFMLAYIFVLYVNILRNNQLFGLLSNFFVYSTIIIIGLAFICYKKEQLKKFLKDMI